MTDTSNYALRLQSSMMKELKKVVGDEGTTINQFINVAVAEKLAALRTESYFRERAASADLEAFWSILERAGTEDPRKGDELPVGYTSAKPTRRKKPAHLGKSSAGQTKARNQRKNRPVETSTL
jgi:hypothetical protein